MRLRMMMRMMKERGCWSEREIEKEIGDGMEQDFLLDVLGPPIFDKEEGVVQTRIRTYQISMEGAMIPIPLTHINPQTAMVPSSPPSDPCGSIQPSKGPTLSFA